MSTTPNNEAKKCGKKCNLVNQIFKGEERESWFCLDHNRPYYPNKKKALSNFVDTVSKAKESGVDFTKAGGSQGTTPSSQTNHVPPAQASSGDIEELDRLVIRYAIKCYKNTGSTCAIERDNLRTELKSSHHKAIQSLLQRVREEVIGENEFGESHQTELEEDARNKLKVDQRTALDAIEKEYKEG